MTKTYSEKLRDPRWQKKRLEILQRDEWECKLCGETERTLNVHHKRYIWGKEPWEVPDEALVTLCENCHEVEGDMKGALDDLRMIIADRFSSDEIHQLTATILENCPPERWGTHYLPASEYWLLSRRQSKYLWSLTDTHGLQ